MFENYSQSARRVIFFARYEATQDWDSQIRCIHLLAGLGKQMPDLLAAVRLTTANIEKLREPDQGLVQRADEALPFGVNMPLDAAAERALRGAAEAAYKSRSKWVGPQHLLGAIWQADPKLREALLRAGVDEARIEAACADPRFAGEDSTLQHGADATAVWQTTSRTGIGYDLHRLVAGRKLILGGIEVPFEKGPAGHSDGDVLSHAICDALLGAAGLGDIGTHFPDTDPQWKGASSLQFLESIREKLAAESLRIVHIDAVVVAEQPKLGPYFPDMRAKLAGALGIALHQINLKAKTNEGVDAIGRGEAMAAHAVATLEA